MTGMNVCAVCMDPMAGTHRYVTGFKVLFLCDGCAERMRMTLCRADDEPDGTWRYPTYDMSWRK